LQAKALGKLLRRGNECNPGEIVFSCLFWCFLQMPAASAAVVYINMHHHGRNAQIEFIVSFNAKLVLLH
jgi:hypothetical protein